MDEWHGGRMTSATAAPPCLHAYEPGHREADRALTDGPAQHADLIDLVRRPWTLRLPSADLTVRGATPRDLHGVSGLHARCSARSLLDRYRLGGRKPAVAAVEQALRRPLSFVVCAAPGEVVAMAVLALDQAHSRESAEVGLLVADAWQGRGIGREVMAHVAGSALVVGYTELIAYPATTATPARRLLLEVGHTRVVPDPARAHLHTFLPEAAGLGLGPIRERLAG
jgi:GNAT superfamily N-acetyltransferase